ncbi:MAG TPA: GNAT family N-acetyltransferase [Methyloceanibacter sp.]|jgi:predicted N-acetyltransferase YhbS|nr:GNAT family N-acetyltransferase [Methyloceanibacter sp.]
MMTFEIHPETEADIPALNALSATAFGPGRFVRSAYRVREGIAPVSGLSLTAWCEGRVAGGVRFTAICVGDHDGGLLLGPLVVDPALTGKGCGKALLEEGLGRAREAGFGFVLLVGDMPYYGRFGFKPSAQGAITLRGPVDPARLLGVELVEGTLDGAAGQVRAYESG